MRIKVKRNFCETADFVLYEGNCLDLLETIPDNTIQLAVTSPPYNLGKEYENHININSYKEEQRKIINECVRVVSSTGSICWQVGNYVNNGTILPLDIMLYDIFEDNGLRLRNRIIWHFGHGLHSKKRFSGRYEVILWFTKSDNYIFNLDPVRVPQKYPGKKHFKGPNKGKLSGNPNGKNPSDIWEIPNVKSNHVEKTIHPCQFPIELIERLVLALTNPGDWVLDPFLGVGSTALAALAHKRRTVGAEIKSDYNDITYERIALAEQGKLRIRPMERSVYDPNNPTSIPPKTLQLSSLQTTFNSLKE